MKIHPIAVAPIVFLVSCSFVWADFEPWLKGPCASDFRKFCNDAPPGTASVIDCFNAHEKELSPACRAKRAERKSARKAMKVPSTPKPTPEPSAIY